MSNWSMLPEFRELFTADNHICGKYVVSKHPLKKIMPIGTRYLGGTGVEYDFSRLRACFITIEQSFFIANFSGAVFCHNKINSCIFYNCQFDGTVMFDNVFTNCNFENCSFEDTRLQVNGKQPSTFKNCTFIGCANPLLDITNVVFENCTYKETSKD